MKKIGILIGIVIVLLIIMFFIIKSDNQNENVLNTNVEANQQQGKIEQFEEQLKEKGITLSNKQEITSEQINENGYSYELNKETIEIYNVAQEKISNIIVEENGHEIAIRTMQGETINAIYYDEILILNCRENSEKILDALLKIK